MGIKLHMGIEDNHDVCACKSSNAKSFGYGNNNIFN